jgi:lipoprotein-releasing system permease protein
MAVLFYILQLKYGLIGVPDGFAVDSYPILMKPKDIIAVALVIFIIALFASWIPSKKAAQMITLSRND